MIEEKIKTNRLPREYIVPGNVIWYSGMTSRFGWNCPAEIIKVDTDDWFYEEAKIRGYFTIMSIDDCREQHQTYSFDILPHSPESRCSMFVPSEDEMDLWLNNYVGARSLGIEERNGQFVVVFEARPVPAFQWAISRWALRKGVRVDYMVGANEDGVVFDRMEDAALCHLTFSQGIKWSMIA